MSNLFKSGFQNIKSVDSSPYIIDVNNKKISTETSKVIRPLEEKEDFDNSNMPNEAILEDAMSMAKTLRDDAMMKAAAIVADAQAEAANILEQAKEEGYRQGLEEGNMEAMRRADVYLEQLQKEQNERVAANEQELLTSLEQAKEDLTDVFCMLVEKMTGILIEDYKPVLLHLINNSLSNVETSKNYIIKVSEQRYSYITDNKDRILGANNPSINMEIFGDPKLSDDQCIIETDNGIIDLSMDVQVKNLITAIKLLS